MSVKIKILKYFSFLQLIIIDLVSSDEKNKTIDLTSSSRSLPEISIPETSKPPAKAAKSPREVTPSMEKVSFKDSTGKTRLVKPNISVPVISGCELLSSADDTEVEDSPSRKVTMSTETRNPRITIKLDRSRDPRSEVEERTPPRRERDRRSSGERSSRHHSPIRGEKEKRPIKLVKTKPSDPEASNKQHEATDKLTEAEKQKEASLNKVKKILHAELSKRKQVAKTPASPKKSSSKKDHAATSRRSTSRRSYDTKSSAAKKIPFDLTMEVKDKVKDKKRKPRRHENEPANKRKRSTSRQTSKEQQRTPTDSGSLDRSFTHENEVLGYDDTLNDLEKCIGTMAPDHNPPKEVIEDSNIPLTLDSPMISSSPVRKGDGDSKDKVNLFSDGIGVINIKREICEKYKRVGDHHNSYYYGSNPKTCTKNNAVREIKFSNTHTCTLLEYRGAKETHKYFEYIQKVTPKVKCDPVNFYFHFLLGKEKKTQLEDPLISLSLHDVVRMISNFVKSEFSIFKNTVSKFKSKWCWENNQIVMKTHQLLISILSTIFCNFVMYLCHVCNFVCNFVLCNLLNIVFFTQSGASPLLRHLTITQVHIEPTFYLSRGRC